MQVTILVLGDELIGSYFKPKRLLKGHLEVYLPVVDREL
jgi:hypothetical protein